MPAKRSDFEEANVKGESPTSTEKPIGPSSSYKESGSSSDSRYQSFDSKTPSRPTSNEFEAVLIPGVVRSGSTTGESGQSASEYETCATSQGSSSPYGYLPTSQETSYHSAKSSLQESSRESTISVDSSRESTISVDSEASGCLEEMSSEASETVVAGAKSFHSRENDSEEDEGCTTPVNEVREPYDSEISESIIRSGIEVPFMPESEWQFEQEVKFESQVQEECFAEERNGKESQSIVFTSTVKTTTDDDSTTLIKQGISAEEAGQPS